MHVDSLHNLLSSAMLTLVSVWSEYMELIFQGVFELSNGRNVDGGRLHKYDCACC